MNRVVVITGASRGLGLSLVRRFLECGDQVFGVSRTKRFWRVAVESLPASHNLHLFQADLSRESEVRCLAAGVRKKTKRVDILINNAGVGGGLTRIEKESCRGFQRMMDANLLSAFLMCKHFIPLFRRQSGGVIVNVSSMAGQRAVPGLFSYSASKFGVLALSQCLAKENKDRNLKCVTVCPGGMNTGMRAALFGKEDASRQQSPDFVAGVILKVIDGEIKVESGGDIVIRHGKVTAIHPCPGA
jgi:NAD(P)-dependent dehydrogenase (short-subunit alcohol dehydrogenase family)